MKKIDPTRAAWEGDRYDSFLEGLQTCSRSINEELLAIGEHRILTESEDHVPQHHIWIHTEIHNIISFTCTLWSTLKILLLFPQSYKRSRESWMLSLYYIHYNFTIKFYFVFSITAYIYNYSFHCHYYIKLSTQIAWSN